MPRSRLKCQKLKDLAKSMVDDLEALKGPERSSFCFEASGEGERESAYLRVLKVV